MVVAVGPLLGRTELAAPDGSTYLVDDFSCTPLAGEPAAGSDASDVRWVSIDELHRLPCTPLLAETLREWGALG